MSNPGALQSVKLTLSTNTMVIGGLQAQASLFGNYQNQANVNVSSLDGILYQSSAPNIATITAGGTITAKGVGTATISGIFGGKTNSLPLSVALPANYVKPVLAHRYSFSEAPGSTTVKDSVGTANGTIRGLGAAFDGNGQLSLPGGTASNADPSLISGYVELPEHIISVITNISIETWVTWLGSGTWQHIFDLAPPPAARTSPTATATTSSFAPKAMST